MYLYFSNAQLINAGLIALVVLVFALAFYFVMRRRRSLALRTRFGSEYDRAVATHGSADKAEAKLSDRESRVLALEIRDLSGTERARFVSEWHNVQSRFVDYPKAAVTEADDLINALLEARGYPKSNFEQRAADVSVGYPRVMQSYRLANAIAVRPGRVEATTEELRTAMIQYRTMFDELVQPQIPRGEATAA
jgi:hypothetical protein